MFTLPVEDLVKKIKNKNTSIGDFEVFKVLPCESCLSIRQFGAYSEEMNCFMKFTIRNFCRNTLAYSKKFQFTFSY